MVHMRRVVRRCSHLCISLITLLLTGQSVHTLYISITRVLQLVIAGYETERIAL